MGETEAHLDTLWWEASRKTPLHEAAKADFETLRTDNRRQDRFHTFQAIYTGRGITESLALEAEMHARGLTLLEHYQIPAFNLIAMCVDQVVSRICRVKPRAIFQVDAGNWSLRRVAKLGQRWVDHQYARSDFGTISRRAVQDAVLLGSGHAKVYKKPGLDEIGISHVHPSDIFVDPVETAHGEPQRMFQRQFCSKAAARKAFPGHKALIEKSGIMSEADFHRRQEWTSTVTPTFSQIEIIEAWHLPSHKGAKDGRHVIFTSDGVLVDEEWARCDFPIMTFVWRNRPGDSFHGISVSEEILPIHLDLGFTIQMIAETAEMTASPVILSPQSANMSKAELGDGAGQVWEYDGNIPPQIVQNQKIPMDLVGYAQELERRAYRRIGLDSPMIPTGNAIETGKGIRNHFEAQQLGLVNAMINWEGFYQQFGYKCLAAGKQIHAANPKFTVVVPKNKYSTQRVPWEDVSVDPSDDTFNIKVFAGTQLSQHPSGRIEEVQALMNAQIVTDKSEARALTNLPDLEHSDDLATATRDAIEAACEDMLDEGRPHVPEPLDDLVLAINIVKTQYLRARTEGAPEDRLQLMRNYLDRAAALREKQEAAAVTKAQGMVPQGATPLTPDATGANPAAILEVN